MFIIWRRQRINSTRKTELFVDYDTALVAAMAGAGDQGRRSRTPTGQRPAWKPLWCNHDGAERFVCTPLLVQTKRVQGRPRQQLLLRLPSIRTCCLSDPFLRAAWWQVVDERLKAYRQTTNPAFRRQLSLAEKKLRATCERVVPFPTPAAQRCFTRYRSTHEAERRRKDEAALHQRQVQEAERVRQEAERRKQEAERQRQEAERQKQDAERHRRAGEHARQSAQAQAQRQSAMDCWTVLGLPRMASRQEIRRRHRVLALKHHPDRGGDPVDFKRIQAAYETAIQLCGEN